MSEEFIRAINNMKNRVQNFAPLESLPKPSLPDIGKILIDIPIYTPIDLVETTDPEFRKIKYFDGTVDIYCGDCEKETVFKSVVYREPVQVFSGMGGVAPPIPNERLAPQDFTLTLTCTRNSDHHVIFYFKVHNGQLMKVGQFPSAKDLQSENLEKYNKILAKDKFNELRTGIGLASHGVGIGSFLYLRRVFESLITDAYEDAAKNSEWLKTNDEEFNANGTRVVEKIKLLGNDYLPNYLVENRNIYGILSKGIHTLSEDECSNFFPAMRVGIELILDEKLERTARAKKIAENEKDIQNILSRYGKES